MIELRFCPETRDAQDDFSRAILPTGRTPQWAAQTPHTRTQAPCSSPLCFLVIFCLIPTSQPRAHGKPVARNGLRVPRARPRKERGGDPGDSGGGGGTITRARREQRRTERSAGRDQPGPGRAATPPRPTPAAPAPHPGLLLLPGQRRAPGPPPATMRARGGGGGDGWQGRRQRTCPVRGSAPGSGPTGERRPRPSRSRPAPPRPCGLPDAPSDPSRSTPDPLPVRPRGALRPGDTLLFPKHRSRLKAGRRARPRERRSGTELDTWREAARAHWAWAAAKDHRLRRGAASALCRTVAAARRGWRNFCPGRRVPPRMAKFLRARLLIKTIAINLSRQLAGGKT